MLFIGTKAIQNKLPSERKVCPNCMKVTEHDLVDVDTRLTLYFIPLLSIKREVVYRCLTCGDTHNVPYEEYANRHADEVKESWQINKPEPEKVETGGSLKNTQKEKARVILEGKVIDNSPRPNLNIDSDKVLRTMWIAFGVVALLAIALLILVFTLLLR